MKFAKYLVAAAISAAFIAGPASAATMGMADLTIKSLLIVDANNQLTSGITIQNESRTGTATAKYNGVDANGQGSQTEESDTIGGTVDVKYRCGGPSCGPALLAGGTENNFTAHVGAPNGNYALSDMYLTGNALNNAGAQGLTRADSSVVDFGNKATGNSTIANAVTSLATFAVGTTIDAKFLLSYDAYVAAFVDTLNGVTGASLATISWALTLQEVIGNVSTTIMTWSPSAIQRGLTSNNPSQNATYSSSGSTESALVTLTAGRTYKLAINQASNSSASERGVPIPEPTSMLLVALGLFALGAASRRRNK